MGHELGVVKTLGGQIVRAMCSCGADIPFTLAERSSWDDRTAEEIVEDAFHAHVMEVSRG